MLGRLLLGELALADEFVHERMVLGEPLERVVAVQVRAAVTDVRDREVGVLEVGRRQGRPHPREVLLGVRALVDDAVGLPHAGGEPLLGGAIVRQPLGEGVDGEPRGDLTGLGPAHPVGDDEQRRARKRGILVSPALAAGVGPFDGLSGAKHASLLQVGELRIADPDAVAGVQRLGPGQRFLVEICAIRRTEIFDDDDMALARYLRVA